jgi:ribosomal protein S18 acetylase RimI-like enzyme
MPTTYDLRPARGLDFPVVARLFQALHEFNGSLDPRFQLDDRWHDILREHFLRSHTTPGAYWLLAWADAHPVGLLIMEAHTDSPLFADRCWAELVALYVVPEQRGSNLAQCMVDNGKNWAAERGFDRIQLYVTASNMAARRFYARCGFGPVQEIWRTDITPTTNSMPLLDISGVAEANACQLESGHHHLAIGLRHQSET